MARSTRKKEESPDQSPTASQTSASEEQSQDSLVGPPATPDPPAEYEIIQIGEIPEPKKVEVEKPVVTVDEDGTIQIK